MAIDQRDPSWVKFEENDHTAFVASETTSKPSFDDGGIFGLKMFDFDFVFDEDPSGNSD